MAYTKLKKIHMYKYILESVSKYYQVTGVSLILDQNFQKRETKQSKVKI